MSDLVRKEDFRAYGHKMAQRIVNSLINNNDVTMYSQLAAMSDAEILRMPNCGRLTLKAVRNVLEARAWQERYGSHAFATPEEYNRFRLDDVLARSNAGQTLEEISTIYGVSRERARQLVVVAQNGISGKVNWGDVIARCEPPRNSRWPAYDPTYDAACKYALEGWNREARGFAALTAEMRSAVARRNIHYALGMNWRVVHG